MVSNEKWRQSNAVSCQLIAANERTCQEQWQLALRFYTEFNSTILAVRVLALLFRLPRRVLWRVNQRVAQAAQSIARNGFVAVRRVFAFRRVLAETIGRHASMLWSLSLRFLYAVLMARAGRMQGRGTIFDAPGSGERSATNATSNDSERREDNGLSDLCLIVLMRSWLSLHSPRKYSGRQTLHQPRQYSRSLQAGTPDLFYLASYDRPH